MESQFAEDFGQVRVHSDARAANAAETLNARAFTVGPHIVFAGGQYRPMFPDGRRLLAHELAHVVQQRGTGTLRLQRQVATDASAMSLTPDYVAGLGDNRLREQIAALQAQLGALTQSTPESAAMQANLQLLQAELDRRTARAANVGGNVVGQVERPPGLPIQGGFLLQPAPPTLQDLNIPEGQIVELPAPRTLPGAAQPGAARPTALTSPLAGGSSAMLGSINAKLRATGFAAAGENAIVVVGIPRWFTPGARIPESTSTWGHTAVGVRIGGRIEAIRGFNPESTLDVLRNYSGVRSGSMAVPAQITNDIDLLTKTGAMTIEYPVTREMAEAFARGLPLPGPVAPGGPGYTTVPAEFGTVCQGQNCVLFATSEAERVLGGRIGPAGGTPVTDIPRVGEASQGRLIGLARDAAEGTQDLAPMANATGEAVASAMPRALRLLKVGGRVMIVVSIAMIPVETYLAPPEQRARTFVGATGGFLGGFAAGAAAGLVCGPGAVVCSIILGLIFGLGGYYAGRGLAEGMYDVATDPNPFLPRGSLLAPGPYGPYGPLY